MTGVVMIPGAPQLKSNDIKYRIDNSQAVCVFADSSAAEKVDEVHYPELHTHLLSEQLCAGLCVHNVHSLQHTYMNSSYRSNKLGLSHWDPYALHRGGCLSWLCSWPPSFHHVHHGSPPLSVHSSHLFL